MQGFLGVHVRSPRTGAFRAAFGARQRRSDRRSHHVSVPFRSKSDVVLLYVPVAHVLGPSLIPFGLFLGGGKLLRTIVVQEFTRRADNRFPVHYS